MVPLAFMGNIGLPEIIIILMIGLLLFGSRLPEVGRSLGRGLLEFKKGLRGVQDQMDDLEREADRRVDEEIARRQKEEKAPVHPKNQFLEVIHQQAGTKTAVPDQANSIAPVREPEKTPD